MSKFHKYDYSKDKDFSGLDTTPHPMLDKVPRKSIKDQVELFLNAGVQLEMSRRAMMSEGLTDDQIPDDLDELETILDKPDLSIQDYDDAISYLKDKKKVLSSEQKKQKKQVKSDSDVDNKQQSDNNDKQGES